MKLSIAGTEYKLDGVRKLTTFDLLEMKRQTGMDVDRLEAALTTAQQQAEAGNENWLVSNEEGLLALATVLWVTRRKAGERDLTLEQACDFPLEDLQFISEPEDESPEPDPS